MLYVGVLQQPPLLVGQAKTAAVLAGRPHLGEDSREHWIALKAHSGLELTHIVLVLEHGLRDSVLLRLAFWLGEKGAHSWNRRELQRIA